MKEYLLKKRNKLHIVDHEHQVLLMKDKHEAKSIALS